MYDSKNKPDSSDSLITLVGNVLKYKKHNKSVKLSKNQEMLFICLLSGKVKKEQIMKFVWGGGGMERSYNKLIYRTRIKLIKAGFPRDLILTIPKTGVYLNNKPATPKDKFSRNSVDLNIDARVMNVFHM